MSAKGSSNDTWKANTVQNYYSDTIATELENHAAAASAATAIAATEERITGLLVDYHLDRGNGIAAIRDIRQRFGENIPAILITADRSPHVRDAAREDGIVVLNKPVKPAALRALLGQWRTQQMVAAE